MSTLKNRLLSEINFVSEFNELLGSGKGNARRCWNRGSHNNDDKSMSLSFNPEHGGWKCHACSETGDIFTLYMKVRGIDFPTTMQRLLEKYGLWNEVQDYKRTKNKVSKRKNYKAVSNGNIKSKINVAVSAWADGTNASLARLNFMQTRYGLRLETLIKYRIGYNKTDSRVWIPIWVKESQFTSRTTKHDTRLASFVNVRKHDCFRSKCQWHNKETGKVEYKRPESINLEDIALQTTDPWQPIYGDRSGKVISIKGHGCTYLYPFEVMFESPSVYLVGGELKSLLLNQVGVPAVTFTSGEGGYDEDFLYYFIGKSVRVLMDADEAGEKASEKLSQVLANYGAYVEVGHWTDEVKEILPDKGDVTDYLRLCNWMPESLNEEQAIVWKKVERQYTEEQLEEHVVDSKQKLVDWNEMQEIKFSDLVNPNMLNEWVRVEGVLAGRGETPFVVPQQIDVSCMEGKARFKPKCKSCTLPHSGFKKKVTFKIGAQLEMIGMTGWNLDKKLKMDCGIPKGCTYPVLDVTPASVESTVITPTVEVAHNDDEWADDFEYAHRAVYFLSEQKHVLEENRAYEVGGKVLANPKNGTFALAATKYRSKGDDILRFRPKVQLEERLNAALHEGKDDRVKRIITDIRDHVTHIYGQDGMLLSMILPFFMPFTFKLGHFRCERICPSVMILGDTTTGKSTALKAIIRHFGAGRMASAASQATFAGLVGGNIPSNLRMSFAWGLLPTSHRTLVGLDEYNKMSLDNIGALTDTLSSGIAERVTANGRRRTRCWVRLVYLCNPRGARKLGSYTNPLDAALAVAGTVQDLGRIEYVHIQYAPKTSIFDEFPEPESEHTYTKELARYHLSWLWSLHPKQIHFDSAPYVFKRSLQLADRFGGHYVFLPAQARFKLGRTAAAFAGLLRSKSRDGGLRVKNEHVDMASHFFESKYADYINPMASGSYGTLPTELITVLDSIPKFRRLRFLCNSEMWSRADIQDALGMYAEKFIDVAQFELGIITRKKNSYYPKYDTWPELLESYINERERLDIITRDM